jgi:hypothetical protein
MSTTDDRKDLLASLLSPVERSTHSKYPPQSNLATELSIHEERLKLEYNTLMDEYKEVRNSINVHLQLAAQITTITITAGGILIAGAQYLVAFPALFLIAPFIFYALAWIHMRNLLLNNHLGDYIIQYLRPHIQQIIQNFSPETHHNLDHIIAWDVRFRQREHKYPIWLLPALGATYGFNLLAATFSILTFAGLMYQGVHSLQWFDIALLLLNILFLGYTIILAIWARSSLWKPLGH